MAHNLRDYKRIHHKQTPPPHLSHAKCGPIWCANSKLPFLPRKKTQSFLGGVVILLHLFCFKWVLIKSSLCEMYKLALFLWTIKYVASNHKYKYCLLRFLKAHLKLVFHIFYTVFIVALRFFLFQMRNHFQHDIKTMYYLTNKFKALLLSYHPWN